jgi:hypothetical protein
MGKSCASSHPIHAMTSPLADIVLRAEHYRRNCQIIARGQYLSSEELQKRHLQLGIPVLAASTVVGATIFGTLQTNPAIGWKIATAMVSMAAALLAGLQTLLNFSERAEKHKSAGANYSAMKRDLDIFILRFSQADDDQRSAALTELEKLHQEVTKLAQESPNLADRHWDKANGEHRVVADLNPHQPRFEQQA